MRAMRLEHVGPIEGGRSPLVAADVPVPRPGRGELLIRVSACGVCHTELDEIEGRTPPSALPRVPGHQVVGRVAATGDDVDATWRNARVGVAWIHSACGSCRFCADGVENLCEHFVATGRDVDGGYAEFTTVPAAFAHHLPDVFSDIEAAPLLCAGAVGYRALRLTGLRDGEPLGLTGFGASGHLVLSLARHLYPRSSIAVFARRPEERAFARDLGATWTGNTTDRPPHPLAAIIDTTPAWTPIVEALEALDRGGRLVVNAIRKEDGDRSVLERLDYARHLWLEKSIRSVANVTRADVREFLAAAAAIPIRAEVRTFPLGDANAAILSLRADHVRGATVLTVD